MMAYKVQIVVKTLLVLTPIKDKVKINKILKINKQIKQMLKTKNAKNMKKKKFQKSFYLNLLKSKIR